MSTNSFSPSRVGLRTWFEARESWRVAVAGLLVGLLCIPVVADPAGDDGERPSESQAETSTEAETEAAAQAESEAEEAGGEGAEPEARAVSRLSDLTTASFVRRLLASDGAQRSGDGSDAVRVRLPAWFSHPMLRRAPEPLSPAVASATGGLTVAPSSGGDAGRGGSASSRETSGSGSAAGTADRSVGVSSRPTTEGASRVSASRPLASSFRGAGRVSGSSEPEVRVRTNRDDDARRVSAATSSGGAARSVTRDEGGAGSAAAGEVASSAGSTRGTDGGQGDAGDSQADLASRQAGEGSRGGADASSDAETPGVGGSGGSASGGSTSGGSDAAPPVRGPRAPSSGPLSQNRDRADAADQTGAEEQPGGGGSGSNTQDGTPDDQDGPSQDQSQDQSGGSGGGSGDGGSSHVDRIERRLPDGSRVVRGSPLPPRTGGGLTPPPEPPADPDGDKGQEQPSDPKDPDPDPDDPSSPSDPNKPGDPSEPGEPKEPKDPGGGGGDPGEPNRDKGGHSGGEWDPWENLHDFTGLPMTEDGWTDFNAMISHPDYYNDARVVYVSSSEGDDASARVYPISSSVIGDDPFLPQGSVMAFETISAAYSQLRDGYPDIMLLKRGDVWEEGFGNFRPSGRSNLERMIVGTYGESKDRPILRPIGRIMVMNGGGGGTEREHLVFMGFRAYAAHKDPESRVFQPSDQSLAGFGLIYGGSGILLEDIHTEFMQISIQGFSEPWDQIALRRSIIEKSYSLTSHAQGVFCNNTKNLLIEGCVFDRNGWHPDVKGAEPTQFNHNVYVQHDVGHTIFRDNITMRGSLHNAMIRASAVAENNLSVRGTRGLLVGTSSRPGTARVVARRNVTMWNGDNGGLPGGQGFGFGAVHEGIIEDNIALEPADSASVVGGIRLSGSEEQPVENTVIRNNIVRDYERGIWAVSHATISLIENDITLKNRGERVIHMGDECTVASSSKNRFFSHAAASGWIRFNGADMSLKAWASHVGDGGSVAEAPRYPDPDRNLQTYLDTHGISSAGKDEAMDLFMAEVRRQSRLNWRDAFTAPEVNAYIRAGFGYID